MLKYFRVPFALSGNRTPIPDAANANGFVSYIEGYGPDYQRAKTDVLSKNIERDKMNELFFDITNAIAELQAQGVPDWITTVLNGGSPFSYAKNAIVRYTDGNVYMSLVDANTAAPTDLTKWAPLTASGLLDRLSLINPFKAVGDGAASDQTPVANAIAALRDRILTNEGYKFLVTSISNPRGVDLGSSFGHIVKNITGGQQKLNSPADREKYVFGREYLAAWHNLLLAQSAAATRKPIAVFSGDSTTAGTAVSADYQIHALTERYGRAKGLATPFGLSFINGGNSGWNTEMWRVYAGGLALDLTRNPDLYVLRWGINDPSYYSSNFEVGPPADAGQNYPGRRTPTDYLNSLRAGLATIRASRPVSNLSILLMSPNSTSDTPNARDELWYEQILPGIKQAARDYQCCFIDTFSYLRDARPAAALWMDNPFADGRAIHPLNVMNIWIADIIGNAVFPDGLAAKISRTNFAAIGGLESIGSAAAAPSTYDYGMTTSRSAAGSGFPYDGMVLTFRWTDEVLVQYCFPYKTAETFTYQWRIGRAVALSGNVVGWDAWNTVDNSTLLSAVTASAGYTNPGIGGARVAKSGPNCTVEGYLTQTTPAIIAANTQIGQIAAGYQPQREALITTAGGWDGTNYETLTVRITTGGQITLLKASTLSISRVYLQGAWNSNNSNSP